MLQVKFALILLFVLSSFANDCSKGPTDNWNALTQDKFVEKLTNSSCYDKDILPTSSSSSPLNVSMDVVLYELQAAASEFTSYMTIKHVFKDERLSFANVTYRQSILGDVSLKEKIWTPNIFIKDDLDTTVIEISQKDILVTITNSGLVTYSYKMVSKFYCRLDLRKFPFDSQQCTIKFSDWSYNETDLKLTLGSIKIAENLQFTEYVIDSYNASSDFNKGPYVSDDILDEYFDDLKFSELKFTLNFHRNIGYYMFDFFVPSYLLVLTAWVTFWLQADAGPPRATLGASTVIAFITLHLGVAKDIPKVSYTKASDIWFLGISLFIFTSLAEFAFVNVIWRRRKIVELKHKKPMHVLRGAVMPSVLRKELRHYESQQSIYSSKSSASINSASTQPVDEIHNGHYRDTDIESGNFKNSSDNLPTQQHTWKAMTPQEVAIYIDRKARLIFPLAFLIFNLLYWVFVYCL